MENILIAYLLKKEKQAAKIKRAQNPQKTLRNYKTCGKCRFCGEKKEWAKELNRSLLYRFCSKGENLKMSMDYTCYNFEKGKYFSPWIKGE